MGEFSIALNVQGKEIRLNPNHRVEKCVLLNILSCSDLVTFE
jgi:hypothetical protein